MTEPVPHVGDDREALAILVRDQDARFSSVALGSCGCSLIDFSALSRESSGSLLAASRHSDEGPRGRSPWPHAGGVAAPGSSRVLRPQSRAERGCLAPRERV